MLLYPGGFEISICLQNRYWKFVFFKGRERQGAGHSLTASFFPRIVAFSLSDIQLLTLNPIFPLLTFPWATGDR